MEKILIVEDEKHMLDLLSLELSHAGYNISCATDGDTALKLALEQDFDLIILDLMIPKINGVEVTRRLRLSKLTPIIMLTARDSVMDKVNGLEAGADDYLAKPFAMEELLARIRSVIRRNFNTLSKIKYRDLILDCDSFTLINNNEEVLLSAKEFQMLRLFLKNPHKVFTRDDLLEEVWGYCNDSESNVVDVYISHLRSKLEKNDVKYIHTIHGVGYTLK
ncbi:MAG: response regulator transcription factor [Anaerorhabdus sp.]